MLLASSRKKPALGFGGQSTDTLTLHVHEQQPVHGRYAHERLVLERELYLGLQWKRDGHRLYDEYGQRANGFARLHVHVR